MNMPLPRKVFLTFDVEDFINDRSIKALHYILKMLDENKLKAIFFITGHMAEKLAGYKEIVDMLSEHQIGYHSSSHSVKPTILEYTDIEDYEEARLESLRRETSHINPLTGEIEGKGGIHVLRELFPNNRIEAFRSPDYCWSPPHLEALRDLGIKYDFSAKISPVCVSHKEITFYPYPICHDWDMHVYFGVLRSVLSKGTTVLNFHHWYFVNNKAWNHFYIRGNPKILFEVNSRSYEETVSLFTKFGSFLRKIRTFQKTKAVELTPELEKPERDIFMDSVVVGKICNEMVVWFKNNYFYEPTHLCRHFEKFFLKA